MRASAIAIAACTPAATVTDVQAQTISFVQANYATPQTPPSSVTVPFRQPQTLGNLNVVVVGWADGTTQVQSVSDTKGNVYVRAVGPTASDRSLSIYYAKNIVAAAANANAVTVTFNTRARFPDIRIAEYSGIDRVNPVDATSASQGNSSTSTSGSVTTTNANDLLVAANDVKTVTTAAGPGFTNRLITNPDGDILEDRVVTATGTYTATASLSPSGSWVMQIVAFRGTSSTPSDGQPPSNPAGLAASAASSNQINLGWGASFDNVGVTNYLVERCQGSGCTTFAQIATPTTTTYNDAGLLASTSYTYRVRAADAAGNLSGYSATASATTSAATDAQPPTAPGVLTASAVSSSQIDLSWAASADNVGVTSYLIERCQGSGCTGFTQIATPTTTTYSDAGLLASTSYTYRVRATDAAGNLSGYSATASATTSATTTPIAFRQANYATPQTPQSSVTVSFTQPQTLGNLNVVVVGWSDGTTQVQSVSDTKGNVYVRAVGPTVSDHSQSIYYATNIVAAAANANAVIVAFNTSARYPDIRIAEYSGIDRVNPVDATSASQGNSSTSTSGSVTTTNANDLLVAANDVETITTAAGPGFTNRLITNPDGDILEDRVVTATGTYTATASLSPSGSWVMQMVAFRAAGGTAPPPPPPPVPTITALNPGSGPVGTLVTISGSNFGATKGSSTVAFNGTLASPTSWSETSIVAPVPAGATSGSVVVSVNSQTSNGASFLVVSSSQTVAYPLKASANGRYLVDQNNVPYLLVGDTAHALTGNMSPSDAVSYFANRQSHHFNSVVIYAPCGTGNHCNSNGTTFDGVAPFTTGTSPSTYDLSTPNEVYFSRLDTLLNSAASHGLNILLDPIETGDYLITLRNNGPAKAYNYGFYVGSRYRNFPNIIWLNGEDFQTWTDPSDNNLVAQVMAGIAAADSNHLQTIQLNYFRSYSNQDSAALSPYLSYDMAYTYYETYDYVRAAYNSSPTLPVFLGEANYEGENVTGLLPGPTGPGVLRRQEYWTLLSGGSGHLFGNGLINHVSSGWQASLNSPGAIQIQHSNNLFGAYQWWRLVPDQAHQVVTGGFGVYNADNLNLASANYVTTAWVPDGTLAIAYAPTATSLSVNLSRFVRPVVARWYDPSNGTFRAIAGSPFNPSGIQTISTPGLNGEGETDWVLVLDATVPQ